MENICIIGLTGSQGRYDGKESGSGVGKDTVSDILVKELNFVHLKFASSLRDKFYDAFKLPVEYKGNKTFEMSPIESLNIDTRLIGACKTVNDLLIKYASALRESDPYVFAREVFKEMLIKNKTDGSTNFVISDLRNFEEYSLLAMSKGTVIEVVCPNPTRSKQAMDCRLLDFTDYKVINDSSVEELEARTINLVSNYPMRKTSIDSVATMLFNYEKS